MRENSVLLREVEAGRMQRVRAEIRRRLREQYCAPPMSDHLADLIKKIKQYEYPEQVRGGLGQSAPLGVSPYIVRHKNR